MRKVVLAVMAVTVLVALWERWGQVVRQGPPEPPDLLELLNPDPLGLPEHLASRASRDHPEATAPQAGWVIRGPLDLLELRALRDHLARKESQESQGHREAQDSQGPRDRKARRPPDSSAPAGSHLMN